MKHFLTEDQVKENLKPKFKFNSKWFAAIIEVLEVLPDNNLLSVKVHGVIEPWNLEHTIWGFDKQEYYTETEN